MNRRGGREGLQGEEVEREGEEEAGRRRGWRGVELERLEERDGWSRGRG